jgi:hypothetical protein
LNTVTPGNYTFIQEAGVASLIGAAAFTGTAAIGGAITQKSGGAGSFDVPASATAITNTTVGIAIDLPAVGIITRVQLKLPVELWQD